MELARLAIHRLSSKQEFIADAHQVRASSSDWMIYIREESHLQETWTAFGSSDMCLNAGYAIRCTDEGVMSIFSFSNVVSSSGAQTHRLISFKGKYTKDIQQKKVGVEDADLVCSIIWRPKAVVLEEISRQGMRPTVAPVNPYTLFALICDPLSTTQNNKTTFPLEHHGHAGA